ncbi:hypothetical protein, partial [Blautia sp.]|uniref:hypothetical protein n=1 Tax=Blautia sp. TaxID=1955243 RepID=UPI003FD6F265
PTSRGSGDTPRCSIGTQVKFDSKSLINHQQSMYVVFKVQRERGKQEKNQYMDFSPVFIIYNHTSPTIYISFSICYNR